MLKKCVTAIAVALLSMVVLAGCGEKAQQDPYAQVTLKQAAYGPSVVSKGYKYKIVNPEIVQASGHLVLIREGNITEIIAGRSLAEKIESLDSSSITFNVVKKYSPFVHFKCEQVISGEDSVFISAAGSIYYPRIVEATEFKSKDHDEYGIDRFRYNDTAGLRKVVDKKFALSCKVAKVEEDGEEVWMLQGARSTLRVEPPDDATEIILRMLADEGLDFEGGVTFLEMEDWPARKNNHISGTVSVDWVKYKTRVFST